MGEHTPELDEAGKAELLFDHLRVELEWMLRAASEWHVQRTGDLAIPGYEVQVFAMDSACLHARTMFEFFTRSTTDFFYGADTYGLPPFKSKLYNDWQSPLHAFLMHMQSRAKPKLLKSSDGIKRPLNEMPVEFGKELVRLWREFARLLTARGDPLGERASAILDIALEHAAAVLVSRMVLWTVEPIDWY